jgi:hypothetical protein
MTYAESVARTTRSRHNSAARLNVGLLIVLGLCVDVWLLLAAAISALV